MTADRRNKRSSRETKVVVEALAERIAPAVSHFGVSLNLVMEFHHHRHHQPPQELNQNRSGEHHRHPRNIAIVGGGPVNLSSFKVTETSALPAPVQTLVQSQPTVLTFPSPIDHPPMLPPPAPPANTTGLGFPDNVSTALETIYNQYEQDPSAFPGSSSSANGPGLVLVQGDQVGIQVHDGNPNDFQNLLNELTNAGIKVTVSSATYGTVVGTLPISELLAVGQLSPSISVTPEMGPIER
jgi:hypothetical protein